MGNTNTVYIVTATLHIDGRCERAQVLEDGAGEAVFETLAEAEAAQAEALTTGAEANLRVDTNLNVVAEFDGDPAEAIG